MTVFERWEQVLDRVVGPAVPPSIKTLPVRIQFDLDPPDQLLWLAHEKFATGEWLWIRGADNRGPHGHCVRGALKTAAAELNDRTHYIEAMGRFSRAVGIDTVSWNDAIAMDTRHVVRTLERSIVGVKA